MLCLHDAVGVPEDGIGVEISSGVEPEIELLLSVAFALTEHIGVENVWFPTHIPQKLKVYLVPVCPLR